MKHIYQAVEVVRAGDPLNAVGATAGAFERAVLGIIEANPDVDFRQLCGCVMLQPDHAVAGYRLTCIFAPYSVLNFERLMWPDLQIDEIPADVVQGLMFKANPRWLLEHLLLETP